LKSVNDAIAVFVRELGPNQGLNLKNAIVVRELVI
jgi:hypothetical protein